MIKSIYRLKVEYFIVSTPAILRPLGALVSPGEPRGLRIAGCKGVKGVTYCHLVTLDIDMSTKVTYSPNALGDHDMSMSISFDLIDLCRQIASQSALFVDLVDSTSTCVDFRVFP